MRYKRMICFILLLSIIDVRDAMSINGDEALELFKTRLSSIKTIKGKVTLSYNIGEVYIGSLKYMSPDKIHVEFQKPKGKIIVCNGKKLWVYDYSSNVCGVQDLDREKYSNITELLSSYIAILLSKDKSGYRIRLTNYMQEYYEITLSMDTTFFLREAVFKSSQVDGFTLSLADVIIDEKMTPGIFDYDVPATALVGKNPLDVR
ncbi:MAG: outer-membrane lipoprotein carrier protein LolA [Spirochaetota bacterium]|nr:outer-membrane lipoprotein carrier protein LolA [Spirochaetota bacterium]